MRMSLKSTKDGNPNRKMGKSYTQKVYRRRYRPPNNKHMKGWWSSHIVREMQTKSEIFYTWYPGKNQKAIPCQVLVGCGDIQMEAGILETIRYDLCKLNALTSLWPSNHNPRHSSQRNCHTGPEGHAAHFEMMGRLKQSESPSQE